MGRPLEGFRLLEKTRTVSPITKYTPSNYLLCNSLDQDYPPSCTLSDCILQLRESSFISIYLLRRVALYMDRREDRQANITTQPKN